MTTIDLLLQERQNLLIDGAMGTELFARGLTAGDPPEMWNLELPHDIVDVHKGYIKAGSDIILTNSFGGTRFRLSLHGLDSRVRELNSAAAQRAREAADATDHTVLVAGSMGPTGELLAPLGAMTAPECTDAFAEQAAGLADGGADLLWIETMSSLDEVEAAIEGARQTTELPIAVTLSYDTAGRTMMGVTGSEAAARLSELDLAAFGANCGNNIAETEAAMRELREAAPNARLIVKANAGIPEFSGDRLVYNGTPEVMAAHVARMVELGIDIIGGCCGTTTPHLALMRDVLDGNYSPADIAPPGPSRPDTPGADAPARRRRRRR